MDLVYIHFGHRRPTFRYGVELGSRMLRDRGIDCRGIAILDRPTPDVEGAVNEALGDYWLDICKVDWTQMAPNWDARFNAGRQFGLDVLEKTGARPKWVCFLDDDIQYGPAWFAYIKKVLADDKVLAWRIVSLFLWNNWHIVNTKQEHRVTHFFRYRPGSKMRTDLVVHHTGDIHEEIEENPELIKTLPWYAIDISGICAQARREMFKRQVQSGKYDPFTFRWIEDPDPMSLEDALRMEPEAYWHMQMKRIHGKG